MTTTVKPDPKPGAKGKGKPADAKPDAAGAVDDEVAKLAAELDAPAKPDAAAPTGTTPTPAELFRAGKTIAQIARALGMGQAKVRDSLRAADVDFSGDKNALSTEEARKARELAEAAARPAAAAKPEKAPRTPIARLDKFLAKYQPGTLSENKQKLATTFADTTKYASVGDRLVTIGKLQKSDPAAFGRAVAALESFLWGESRDSRLS